MQNDRGSAPASSLWTPAGRCFVFALGASSILCLLADFYRVCPMRSFTLYVFVPCLAALAAISIFDAVSTSGQLCRSVVLGLTGGLLAAVAYDVFRLPFVFAREWHLTGIVPPMDLFKVFPGFGAMILGKPVDQANYSLAVHVTGWLYHFSNGATFGVMYLAMIGRAHDRHWAWAVLMALALELGMLLSPYPQVFHIPLTPRFVAVTLAAHAIFGVILGVSVKFLAGGFSANRDRGGPNVRHGRSHANDGPNLRHVPPE